MRRQAISLIEVLICLGLFSILLSGLFFWYRTLNTQKERLNQLKGPLMEERFVQQRLQHILPKVEECFFFTETPYESLVFFFDRGPFLDPQLSDRVLGRLYHDPSSHTLCLGIWPSPQEEEYFKQPSQTLILLDRVESCHFEFYSPPDLFRKPVDPEQVGKPRPSETWQKSWPAAYHTLPALIKIVIVREGRPEQPLEYLFDLHKPILYPKEAL